MASLTGVDTAPSTQQDEAQAADAAIAEAQDPPELAEQTIDIQSWIPESVLPYWELVTTYPALAAVIVATFFYLLAFLLRGILLAGLERLAARTAATFDNQVLAILRAPLFTTVFYIGLIIAVQVAALPFGANVLINLLGSIIIVSWMLAALKLSSAVLEALTANPRFSMIETRTIPLFDLVSKLLILLVASYALLMVWGINPVGWLASAGIVGIAVGFAAKDTLANLFSGLFILADSPYQLGDYINLDSGERGMVTGIGMRSTRLLTRDDVEITVPNAVIASAKITNESGGPHEKMRIRVAVGAAYGSDVDEVCAVLLNVGESHEATCSDPAPRVRMRGFGASSLDFELLCWIDKPELRGRITHEVLIAVYKAFDTAGIEIPYTKQDLYIKELPSTAR